MSSYLANTFKIVFILSTFAAAFVGHQWWMSRNSGVDGGVPDLAMVSSKEILQGIEEDVAELAKIAERPDGADATDPADSIRELITRIDSASQTLRQRGDNADVDSVAVVSMLQLHAYYFASVRRPQLYGERLAELASQVERDHPNTEYSFRAAVLRFASQHDFNQPLAEEDVRALMVEACGDLSPQQETTFYGFVSNQLYSNGQTASAKAVLDAGLERFRGQAGWHALFKLQFDQGHLEAPPQVDGGAFTTESYQSRSAGASRQPGWAGGGGGGSVDIFAQGREVAALQEKIVRDARDSIRQGAQEMSESLVKQGYTHFEQSLNGGQTNVFVRDGRPVSRN